MWKNFKIKFDCTQYHSILHTYIAHLFDVTIIFLLNKTATTRALRLHS